MPPPVSTDTVATGPKNSRLTPPAASVATSCASIKCSTGRVIQTPLTAINLTPFVSQTTKMPPCEPSFRQRVALADVLKIQPELPPGRKRRADYTQRFAVLQSRDGYNEIARTAIEVALRIGHLNLVRNFFYTPQIMP